MIVVHCSYQGAGRVEPSAPTRARATGVRRVAARTAVPLVGKEDAVPLPRPPLVDLRKVGLAVGVGEPLHAHAPLYQVEPEALDAALADGHLARRVPQLSPQAGPVPYGLRL